MTTTQTLTRPASLSEYRERLQQTRAPIVTESIQRGLAYQPQPNDLFITPSDKFSATYLQQIVHSLRAQGDLVVGHGVELPPEIGAEMDAIWRETVEPRTGLASYQALRAALA